MGTKLAERGPWSIAGLFALAAVAGCGGGATNAPAPVAPPAAAPAPKPVSVAVAAPQPAAVTVPGAKPNGDDSDQPAKPATIVNKFPSEDPANVFLTGTIGSSMSAAPAPPFRPEDQFAVGYGQPEIDSAQFRVAAVVPVASGELRADLKLPEGFEVVDKYGFTPDGYPHRIRCDKDGKLMAFVPGGSVRVGTNPGTGPAEATPQFVAFLDPFYMDLTEVTVAEFEKYRQSLREDKKRVPLAPTNAAQGSQYPALGLAWGDASTYARWSGKELPTEAEFEKAARGPDAFPHPWGDGRPVWATTRTTATITEVGKFPGDISIYGVYDLAGNGREWTQDWFSPTSHQEAARVASQKALTNWAGAKKAAQGSQRVIKGSGPKWEVFYRWGADMHERQPNVGFRCVLRIPPPPPATAG